MVFLKTSTETRVLLRSYWDRVCLDLYPTWAVWISVWVVTEIKATIPGGIPWLSVCPIWSHRIRGKVGGQEGAEGFTPKSVPLGHKSGMYHREKKGNTYATSNHHPCFLQNQSNCKTVLYLRDPPTGHHSPSSSGYHGHAVSHRKTRCVFLKPWGWNLSQFFRIQFKGVRLELLAPICKREKRRLGTFFSWRRPSLF